MWDNVLVPTCKLRSASLRVTCPSCDHSSSCFISHAWIASWISVDMIRIVRQSILELQDFLVVLVELSGKIRDISSTYCDGNFSSTVQRKP